MPALLLTILKLIFVALLYLFVWQIARAIAAHIGKGEPARKQRPPTTMVILRSDTQAGIDFTVNDAVVLGRSEQADVRLDDPYASEFHLRLVAGNEGLTLHDLGSTNGTYVNGRRVTAPVELSRGDAVQIGKTVMEVR